MSTNPEISFGDRVRILSNPLTVQLGFGESIGQVYGQTTPSETEVEVIGETDRDYAINVFFKDRNQAYWFAPQLLEFVDHGPGTEVTTGTKRWVRSVKGEWVEESTTKRSWWKFWRGRH